MMADLTNKVALLRVLQVGWAKHLPRILSIMAQK